MMAIDEIMKASLYQALYARLIPYAGTSLARYWESSS